MDTMYNDWWLLDIKEVLKQIVPAELSVLLRSFPLFDLMCSLGVGSCSSLHSPAFCPPLTHMSG